MPDNVGYENEDFHTRLNRFKTGDRTGMDPRQLEDITKYLDESTNPLEDFFSSTKRDVASIFNGPTRGDGRPAVNTGIQAGDMSTMPPLDPSANQLAPQNSFVPPETIPRKPIPSSSVAPSAPVVADTSQATVQALMDSPIPTGAEQLPPNPVTPPIFDNVEKAPTMPLLLQFLMGQDFGSELLKFKNDPQQLQEGGQGNLNGLPDIF